MMIKEYTSEIAAQVGVPLSKITFVESDKVGCIDIHLMTLISKGHLVSVLAYQDDVDNLLAGKFCDKLETKVRTALSRLQMLLESKADSGRSLVESLSDGVG
jgi:hypothetical protein